MSTTNQKYLKVPDGVTISFDEVLGHYRRELAQYAWDRVRREETVPRGFEGLLLRGWREEPGDKVPVPNPSSWPVLLDSDDDVPF